MMEPLAVTTTTPIKTLQIDGFLCLACAHRHTLDKPINIYSIMHIRETVTLKNLKSEKFIRSRAMFLVTDDLVVWLISAVVGI